MAKDWGTWGFNAFVFAIVLFAFWQTWQNLAAGTLASTAGLIWIIAFVGGFLYLLKALMDAVK